MHRKNKQRLTVSRGSSERVKNMTSLGREQRECILNTGRGEGCQKSLGKLLNLLRSGENLHYTGSDE